MGNGTERVKGKAEEIKGAVKATVGDLTHNDQLHAEGHAEQVAGQVRQETAKVRNGPKARLRKSQVKPNTSLAP